MDIAYLKDVRCLGCSMLTNKNNPKTFESYRSLSIEYVQ